MHVGPDRKAGSHKSGPGKLISVPPNVLKSSEAPDLFFTSLEHPFGDDDGDKGPAKSIVENTYVIIKATTRSLPITDDRICSERL